MRTIELPYPPTVNTYYSVVGGRKVLSKRGREYRKEVAWLLSGEQQSFEDRRLALHITVHARSKRRADLDNLLKSLLDAMQYAGLYDDDSQIDDLHIVRGPNKVPASVRVNISVLESTTSE